MKFIINPINNSQVLLNSKKGIELIKEYIKALHEEIFNMVRTGDTKRLQTAIDRGVDINTPSRCRGPPWCCGETPVYVASEYGNDACLTQLIAAGADINTQTRYKSDSPIRVATRYANDACLRQLITAGADVNTPDRYGWTPLMYCGTKQHESCAKLLRAAGAVCTVTDY